MVESRIGGAQRLAFFSIGFDDTRWYDDIYLLTIIIYVSLLPCAPADDKKLSTTLKKLGVTNIPGIEEANMFKDSGDVIHFKNPKGT